MSDILTAAPMEASQATGLYLVRVGYQQEIVPMSAGAASLERGDRVLCRTNRGVEIADVLARVQPDYLDSSTVAGSRLIRKSRPEDALLWKQLTLLSVDASKACQAFLETHGLPDILIEVEPLIDGRTLFFHFLGTPSEQTERHVQELSEVYQKSVAASRFAELLEKGCGPGCGTKEKSGCSTGGCAVCAIAGGCTSKPNPGIT